MKWTILSLSLIFSVTLPAFANFETGLVKFEQGDFSGALEEMTPPATQGDARAQYFVGIIMLNGLADEPRPEEAVQWLKRAAEQDYVEAQVELARLYRTGAGVPEKPAEVVKWYRRAAEQGHVGAQLLVADAYAHGYGVETDYVKAYMWYEIAIRYWGDLAVHARDVTAEQMTKAQIDEARRMAASIPPSARK